MRTGKVKESILKRSVLKQLNMKSRQETDRELSMEIHPVEGWTLAAPRAVYGAINALAAAGAHPHQLAVTILMPETAEEGQLKDLTRDLGSLCKREGLTVSTVYAGVTPAVNKLILSVTGIGRVAAESERTLSVTGIGKVTADSAEKASTHIAANISSLTSPGPGLDLIMAGHAGREGAALLAIDREEELLTRYAGFYIEAAKHFYDKAGMREAAGIMWESGSLWMQDVREGGVFGALWELASALKTGFSVDLKRIPIRQQTIEICEFFALNPYMLLSGGCLLAVCPEGEKTVEKLKDIDVPAAVIGRLTDNKDKIISYDDEIRYLEPTKMDEIYRLKPGNLE